MSSSTSARRGGGTQRRGARGGGGSHGGEEGGGGGGGGDDRLVKVAFARNQAEGEMMQGLLSEAGIPSVLKRSAGFDNPDFLAGGPHDVWVSAASARRAREVLEGTMLATEDEERAELEVQLRLRGRGGLPSPAALAFWVFAAAVGALALVWLLYQVT